MRIKKFLSLTVAAIMAVSAMSISAFAADDNRLSVKPLANEETVYAINDISNDDIVPADNVIEGNPDIQPTSFGTLNAGATLKWGSVDLTVGDTIQLYVTSDKGRSLKAGIVSPEGKLIAGELSTGNGTVTIDVTVSGTYKFYLKNTSTGPTAYTFDYAVF